MNILITANDCANPALSTSLLIIKRILVIVQIVGPILLILSLVLNFTKGTFKPDDKKLLKKILNSFLAMLFVFFMPILIDTVMVALGENFTISSCWNSIDNEKKNEDPEYQDPYDYDEDDKSKLIDDKEYEKSE